MAPELGEMSERRSVTVRPIKSTRFEVKGAIISLVCDRGGKFAHGKKEPFKSYQVEM
jgi:hypothetical protein